jgi:hypothetical protein
MPSGGIDIGVGGKFGFMTGGDSDSDEGVTAKVDFKPKLPSGGIGIGGGYGISGDVDIQVELVSQEQRM